MFASKDCEVLQPSLGLSFLQNYSDDEIEEKEKDKEEESRPASAHSIKTDISEEPLSKNKSPPPMKIDGNESTRIEEEKSKDVPEEEPQEKSKKDRKSPSRKRKSSEKKSIKHGRVKKSKSSKSKKHKFDKDHDIEKSEKKSSKNKKDKDEKHAEKRESKEKTNKDNKNHTEKAEDKTKDSVTDEYKNEKKSRNKKKTDANSKKPDDTPDTDDYFSHWESDDEFNSSLVLEEKSKTSILNQSWESDEDMPVEPAKPTEDLTNNILTDRTAATRVITEKCLEMPLHLSLFKARTAIVDNPNISTPVAIPNKQENTTPELGIKEIVPTVAKPIDISPLKPVSKLENIVLPEAKLEINTVVANQTIPVAPILPVHIQESALLSEATIEFKRLIEERERLNEERRLLEIEKQMLAEQKRLRYEKSKDDSSDDSSSDEIRKHKKSKHKKHKAKKRKQKKSRHSSSSESEAESKKSLKKKSKSVLSSQNSKSNDSMTLPMTMTIKQEKISDDDQELNNSNSNTSFLLDKYQGSLETEYEEFMKAVSGTVKIKKEKEVNEVPIKESRKRKHSSSSTTDFSDSSDSDTSSMSESETEKPKSKKKDKSAKNKKTEIDNKIIEEIVPESNYNIFSLSPPVEVMNITPIKNSLENVIAVQPTPVPAPGIIDLPNTQTADSTTSANAINLVPVQFLLDKVKTVPKKLEIENDQDAENFKFSTISIANKHQVLDASVFSSEEEEAPEKAKLPKVEEPEQALLVSPIKVKQVYNIAQDSTPIKDKPKSVESKTDNAETAKPQSKERSPKRESLRKSSRESTERKSRYDKSSDRKYKDSSKKSRSSREKSPKRRENSPRRSRDRERGNKNSKDSRKRLFSPSRRDRSPRSKRRDSSPRSKRRGSPRPSRWNRMDDSSRNSRRSSHDRNNSPHTDSVSKYDNRHSSRSSPSHNNSYNRNSEDKQHIQVTLQRLAGMDDYSMNKSPINSPLEGLKRSLADSTISDDQLLEHNADDYDSPNYAPMRSKPVESCSSPRRISLDDRINQVLGIKDTPKPQPIQQYQQNYQYNQQQYYNHYGQYGNMHQYHQMAPPPMQEPDLGRNKVLQVGNVLEVVPTEEVRNQKHIYYSINIVKCI